MEAQLYRHYPDGEGCAIILGVEYKDIENYRRIINDPDISLLEIYNLVTTLLNAIIEEAERPEEQGLLAQDQRMKEKC